VAVVVTEEEVEEVVEAVIEEEEVEEAVAVWEELALVPRFSSNLMKDSKEFSY
jgi:hypothetical protein